MANGVGGNVSGSQLRASGTVPHNRNRQCVVSSLGMFASSINLRCLNSSLSGCGPGDRVTTRRYPNK